jgi:acetoacetyl-CoA synthetase
MTEPLWSPGPVRRQTANLSRFIDLARRELDPGIFEYRDLHCYSIEHPAGFWRAVWDFCGIIGKPGATVLENAGQMPGARWFPHARLNFAENLLRRRDDAPAIIFRSETGENAEYSFSELYTMVAQTAAALRSEGVDRGDRVAAYMPNLPAGHFQEAAQHREDRGSALHESGRKNQENQGRCLVRGLHR